MTDELRYFAENLETLLTGELIDSDTFCELARAGELLRRACTLTDEPEEIPELVARYEQMLTDYDGPLPDDLMGRSEAVLTKLSAYAAESPLQRDGQTGERLLEQLDGVVSVAVALVRVGKSNADVIGTLASTIDAKVEALAPTLSELWPAAEMRELTVGLDPEYPAAFAWWNTLAVLSQERAQLSRAVRYADAIDRLSVGFAETMASTRERERAPARWRAALKQALSAVRDIVTVPTFAPAAAAAYDDGTQIPEVRMVLDVGDGMLALLTEGSRWVVRTQRGHSLEAVQVAADGRAVAAERIDAEAFRFVVEPDAQELTVSATIDGETVALPAVLAEQP